MKRRAFLKQLSLAASLPFVFRRGFAADSATKKAVHKILSCNVRVDVAEDHTHGDGWQDRKEFCAEVIRAQKADLIGFQEVQEVHFRDLKQRLPDYDTYALSNGKANFHPNCAIFFSRSRYELITAGGFWLSETPHIAASKSWDTKNSRLVNWVQLRDRASGKELRFWNTHLDHIGHEARAKGAEMIAQASEVLGRDLPQLLTGDMNAPITHDAIKNFIAGGWADTYAAVHGEKDPGYTYHGFKGVNYGATKPNGEPRLKIDWIFSRGAVKPVAATIIRDGRNDHYPSDHYFVSAEVEI